MEVVVGHASDPEQKRADQPDDERAPDPGGIRAGTGPAEQFPDDPTRQPGSRRWWSTALPPDPLGETGNRRLIGGAPAPAQAVGHDLSAPAGSGLFCVIARVRGTERQPTGRRAGDPAAAIIAPEPIITKGRGEGVGGETASVRRAGCSAGGGWLVALIALIALVP